MCIDDHHQQVLSVFFLSFFFSFFLSMLAPCAPPKAGISYTQHYPYSCWLKSATTKAMMVKSP